MCRIFTFINRLANTISKRGRIPRRIVEILKNYCWVRPVGFWLFDLTQSDAPWRRFREQHDNTVRWERATIERCRVWCESGADGFTGWRYDLLVRLIEEKRIVLVGYAHNADNNDPQVPDCYTTLALGYKLVIRRCSFEMEPDEGAIQTAYTREQSRGRGLATRIYAELCCLAEELGLTKVYADIDLTNIASCRAAEKAGAFRMQDVIVYEITFFKHKYIVARGSLKNRFRQL